MIHRFILIGCVALLLPVFANAQGGNWVWVSGPNTQDGTVVYGTRGVAAPGNTPPALYEAAAWMDKQGNFWIFGGYTSGSSQPDDLWKYDPVVRMWTWVKGSGTQSGSGTFGTKGVPAQANNPPGLGWGASTWTDEAGDLWLYGGRGEAGLYGDLWRYNIAGNEWTWMHGGGFVGPITTFGTKGTPSPANTPGQRQECTSTWVDGAGNLWLFGGYDGSQSYNDLWMYNIQIGQWTWMNGSGVSNSAGNYGSMGVASASNLPPARCSYTNWKDASGNFYIFGGTQDLNNMRSDVWKYDPVANLWTWVAGESTLDSPGSYGNYCVNNGHTGPSGRMENRTAQIASCQGNAFYLFGGWVGQGGIQTGVLSDLWLFDAVNNNWTWLDGPSTSQSLGSYGNLGVTSASNQPPARCGQCMWADNAGNLWVFGGTADFANEYSDVWKFVPNPACVTVNLSGGILASSAQSPICIGGSTVLTVTGGDSLQIWPTATAHFTDSTHATVNPDTTTTYIITGHSHCRYSDTTRVTIYVIKPGQMVYQISDTSICPPGAVTVSLTGQAGTQISPLNDVTVLDSVSYLIAPLVTTTYRLTGTSALCGVPDTGMFTIHVIQPNPIIISGPTTVCTLSNIKLTISGLSSMQCPYSPYFNSLITDSQIVFYPAFNSGTYPAYISGFNSCGTLVRDTLQLTWVIAGDVSFMVSNADICPGDSTLLTVNAPPYITVTPAGLATRINSQQWWLKPDVTTNYYIYSSSACLTNNSGYQLVTVLPQPHAAFTLSSQPVSGQTLVTLNNQSTGYTALLWYHDTTLLELTNNTVATTDTGNYCITLIAINNAGCDDTATHCIEIAGQSYLQVPQAFTPNGDGVNDYFTVFGQSLTGYQIRIFNRWGEEVYSSNDLNELNNLNRGWNGTYKGKLQDPASFTWVIKATDAAGNTIEKNGYVVLIR